MAEMHTKNYRPELENIQVTMYDADFLETEDESASYAKKVNARYLIRVFKGRPVECDAKPSGNFIDVDAETFNAYKYYLISKQHGHWISVNNLIQNRGFV